MCVNIYVKRSGSFGLHFMQSHSILHFHLANQFARNDGSLTHTVQLSLFLMAFNGNAGGKNFGIIGSGGDRQAGGGGGGGKHGILTGIGAGGGGGGAQIGAGITAFVIQLHGLLTGANGIALHDKHGIADP